MQIISVIERVSEELLPLTNIGWGEGPKVERWLYVQDGDLVTARFVRSGQYGDF